MTDLTVRALEIAKEITVARMTSVGNTIHTDSYGGESTADFFEAIFKRVVKLSEETAD